MGGENNLYAPPRLYTKTKIMYNYPQLTLSSSNVMVFEVNEDSLHLKELRADIKAMGLMWGRCLCL